MSKKTKAPVQKPWKKHKQKLISAKCGVRVEVDKGIAEMIRFMNMHGIETRYSCEGRKPFNRGYVSMFATPKAIGFVHFVLDNGSAIDVVIERDIDPDEHERVTLRWPKKKFPEFEALVRKYFR